MQDGLRAATVTVVDYGAGNLLSVARAFERVGATPTLAQDARTIESAERLVLPGVGAFVDGMAGLHERDLVEAIRRFAGSGRPLLGICLGMQMLADSSVEFGVHEGLGLVPGRVLPVPTHDISGQQLKIPHVGWAEINPWSSAGWSESILKGTAAGTAFYMVHSYHLVPAHDGDGLAQCLYGGHRITAAVQHHRIIGCQFHPEKSGIAGLRLLSEFLDL